jgi:hypothetical protein
VNKCVVGLVAALVAFSATSAWAQERQITGVVSATGGGPITGVSVSVVGTTFTTVTHEDGRYVIAAPAGAVTVL